jgi:cytochrome c5
MFCTLELPDGQKIETLVRKNGKRVDVFVAAAVFDLPIATAYAIANEIKNLISTVSDAKVPAEKEKEKEGGRRGGEGGGGTAAATTTATTTTTTTTTTAAAAAAATAAAAAEQQTKNRQSVKEARDAVYTVYHQRLFAYHAKRVGKIPDGGKQGKWIKWLFTNHFTVAEAIDEYEKQVAELAQFRHVVDWCSVARHIGQRHAKAATVGTLNAHRCQTSTPLSERIRRFDERAKQGGFSPFAVCNALLSNLAKTLYHLETTQASPDEIKTALQLSIQGIEGRFERGTLERALPKRLAEFANRELNEHDKKMCSAAIAFLTQAHGITVV